MSYKKYGNWISIKDSVPHLIIKLDEIKLTPEETISENDFLRNFRFDGFTQDSQTGEIRIKTKYEDDKVYLLSQDGYFGWARLLPKNNPNPNNILLGDFDK